MMVSIDSVQILAAISYSLLGLMFFARANADYDFRLIEKGPVTFDLRSTVEMHRIGGQGEVKDWHKVVLASTPLHTFAKLKIAPIFADKRSQLIWLQAVECRPIDCQKNGGYLFELEENRIKSVYSNGDSDDNWSIELSFLHLLYGTQQDRGDNNQFEYSILNSTSFSRTSWLKPIGYQRTIMPELEYSLLFNQRVIYGRDSKGLIKRIEAEDEAKIESYSFELANMQCRTIVQRLENEDTKVDDSLSCEPKNLATIEDCITHLRTVNKINRMKGSIDDLRQSLSTTDKRLHAKGHTETKCVLGSKKELSALNSYKTHATPSIFLRILKRISSASTNDLLECLKLKENEANLYGIANALAVSGSIHSYRAVKEYASDDKNDQSVLSIYHSGLPFSLSLDHEILEDIVMSIDTSENVDQAKILSAASTLGRQLKIGSEYTFMLKMEIFLDIFKKKFDACNTDDCFSALLLSLANIGHSKFVGSVQKRLCTDFKFGFLALRYLQTLPPNQWLAKEIVAKLWKIYANRCPIAQEQRTRMLAAKLLLISAKAENVTEIVEKLLASLNEKGKSSREIQAYVTSLIKNLAKDHGQFKKVYNDLRKQWIYNPFFQFLDGAQSRASRRSLETLGQFRPNCQLDLEFGNGVLKRTNSEVGLETNNRHSTIFGFDLFSAGTAYLLNLFGATDNQAPPTDQSANGAAMTSSSSDDDDASDDSPLRAGIQLTLFDHRPAPTLFFESEGQLMSVLWAADGSKLTAFNSTFLLNDFRFVAPLSNGVTAEVDLGAALSLKLGGSAEVSLWYRSLKSTVDLRGSFASVGTMELKFGNNRQLANYSIDLTSSFGTDFLADADFYDTPAKLCFQIDQNIIHYAIKANAYSSTSNETKPMLRIKRRFDGSCISSGREMDRTCTTFYD